MATAGCNNNWSIWYIGSRTQWNVTKDFYMGVDVHVLRACKAPAPLTGNMPVTSRWLLSTDPPPMFVGDQDAVSVEFRVHKDFYP